MGIHCRNNRQKEGCQSQGRYGFHTEDSGDLDWRARCDGGKEWAEAGDILMVKPTGFAYSFSDLRQIVRTSLGRKTRSSLWSSNV